MNILKKIIIVIIAIPIAIFKIPSRELWNICCGLFFVGAFLIMPMCGIYELTHGTDRSRKDDYLFNRGVYLKSTVDDRTMDYYYEREKKKELLEKKRGYSRSEVNRMTDEELDRRIATEIKK